eukprot:2563580-Pleurochrysis_carterae.AAC.2
MLENDEQDTPRAPPNPPNASRKSTPSPPALLRESTSSTVRRLNFGNCEWRGLHLWHEPSSCLAPLPSVDLRKNKSKAKLSPRT